MIWKVKFDLKALNDRALNTMSDFLGITFIDFGDDFLVAKMPINERTLQPAGIMHGGASCTLAESIGSTGANLSVDPTQFYCVGLDININHIRAVQHGEVIATTKPFHLGKSTQVWAIEIKNTEGKLVSVSRLTMSVLKK
ncbi:MAG: PaaI family thioesterase [Gammaproteobacteria bacterium]|nr:PaaI family thioesterase [Gammaproteobacteria bacterium]